MQHREGRWAKVVSARRGSGIRCRGDRVREAKVSNDEAIQNVELLYAAQLRARVKLCEDIRRDEQGNRDAFDVAYRAFERAEKDLIGTALHGEEKWAERRGKLVKDGVMKP